MFTHMVPVKTERHRARDTDYEIFVFQVEETGEYRTFISKGAFGAGDIFTAGKGSTGDDITGELIKRAKDAIDRNEGGEY